MPSTLTRTLLAIASTGIIACENGTPPVVQVPNEIRITPESLSFDAIGDTVRLRAALIDGRGQVIAGVPRVSWATTRLSATVDSTGLVRSMAPGSFLITATSGRLQGSVAGQVAQVPVTVVVTPALDSVVTYNGQVVYSAVVRDRLGAALANPAVTWRSSNDSVTTVIDGVAVARGSGDAVLSASVGAARGQARIAVSLPPTYLRVSAPAHALEGDTVRGIAIEVLDRYERPILRNENLRLVVRHPNGDSSAYATRSSGSRASLNGVTVPVAGVVQLSAAEPVYTLSAGRIEVHLRFRQLSGAFRHTCGLTYDGRAFCWGANANGQLGDGTLVDRDVPTAVATTKRFDRIGASGLGGCGRIPGEGMLCWGVTYSRGQPVTAPTPYARPLGDASPVANTMMPCAIDGEGRGWCWDLLAGVVDGPPGYGEQGIETRSVPIMSSRAGPWRDVAAGLDVGCAIDRAGVAWCAGYNENGQQGLGFADQGVPYARQVNTGVRFSALGVGHRYTCGLALDGGVHCWGANNWLQVDPDSTQRNALAPRLVSGMPTVGKLAISLDMPCALTTGGQAWCWGLYAGGRARAATWGMVLQDLVASQASICGIAADGYTWCGFPYAPPSRLPPPARP